MLLACSLNRRRSMTHENPAKLDVERRAAPVETGDNVLGQLEALRQRLDVLQRVFEIACTHTQHQPRSINATNKKKQRQTFAAEFGDDRHLRIGRQATGGRHQRTKRNETAKRAYAPISKTTFGCLSSDINLSSSRIFSRCATTIVNL